MNRKCVCRICGNPFMSKPEMVVEILRIVGFDAKKSIYGDGTFTRNELYAVFQYLEKVSKKK